MRRKTKNKKTADNGIEEIFTANMEARRNSSERWTDWMTKSFGTLAFLEINCFLFVVWIVWNLGYLPEAPIFDPFPFNLLTLVVSLEAIILSTIVLISQNRAARIADLREEIDLQVNLRAEKQVAKILQILDKHNPNLAAWEKPMDLKTLEKRVEKRMKG
jgi:uncharacterized membrane protein